METLHTWWATELYPMRERDQFGVSGEFEVVLAADAQATIAALQVDKENAQDANRLLRRELDKLREKYDAECVMIKVDGLRAVNRMLREQNRVLRSNLVNCAARLEAYYGEDYPAVRDAKAALTATSATPAYPGVIISGTLKDATNQEGQHE